MSTSTPILADVAVRQRVSTPAQLRAQLAAVGVLALLFFLAVRYGVSEHRSAMKVIGQDSAPSILAAQKIRTALADMHAEAADLLLHPAGARATAAAAYEKRRVEATEAILDAASNVTFGEEERVPLRRMLGGLGRYEAAAARAFVLHQRGDEAGVLAAHREADRIMSQEVLPAADKLDEVNRRELDRAYLSMRWGSFEAVLLVGVAGGALLAVLAGLQVFLYRRMRRVVNPALVLATGLVLGFLVWTTGSFLWQRGQLKVAKQDAFESIHALWRARAEAYDANGDESRYLLDRQRQDAHEQSFRAKSARLIEAPEGTSDQALVEAARAGKPPADVKGYLADELRNITFAGEGEAAADTLEEFLRYRAIDAEIRKLNRAGKRDEARALCLGEKPGESNWAFARFDEALGRTLAINQSVFDETVQKGLAQLEPFNWAAPLAALGVVALAVAGVWPRLREYQAN